MATSTTPLPLVLDLYGSGGTAARQAATSGFETLAARRRLRSGEAQP